VHLDKLADELSQHFGEFYIMEYFAAFVSNPFLPIDTEEVAANLQKAFTERLGGHG